jgi:hypothetical protein
VFGISIGIATGSIIGGSDMQKKTKNRLITIFIIMAIMVGGAAYAVNWAFFNIQRLNGQKYLNESTSSNGIYTVTAYLNSGGATTGFAVLGTLKNNKNGKTKNIYWQYHCEEADMEWLNEERIKINEVELNVKTEIYDYRRK